MKVYFYIITFFIVLMSCNKEAVIIKENSELEFKISSIQEKITNFKDSKSKEVIVVAHRADWRNAPENSLQAIQNCIDMGVDMVEIDIRKTKDGKLVLMHDETIDRTTTGEGLVSEWTLDSLKTLQLIDGLGVATQHKIPTLKDALLVTKGKILVNLDKSYDIFDECFEVIKETGIQDEVIIKGTIKRAEVEKDFGQYLDKVIFMPVVRLHTLGAKEIVDEYMGIQSTRSY